jgi:hypothetical protein
MGHSDCAPSLQQQQSLVPQISKRHAEGSFLTMSVEGAFQFHRLFPKLEHIAVMVWLPETLPRLEIPGEFL